MALDIISESNHKSFYYILRLALCINITKKNNKLEDSLIIKQLELIRLLKRFLYVEYQATLK